MRRVSIHSEAERAAFEDSNLHEASGIVSRWVPAAVVCWSYMIPHELRPILRRFEPTGSTPFLDTFER